MHYLFLDETYRDTINNKIIVVVSWAVDQGRLNDRMRSLDDLRQRGKAPILERIDSTLESLDALALVAWANLNRSLFRPRVVDGTSDIQKMARPDAVWSVSVFFATNYLIYELATKHKQKIGTVDIYYDPRRLTTDHKKALVKVFREDMVSKVRSFAKWQNADSLKKFMIRRIQPVEKPKNDDVMTKFQMGTWVSHRLCSKSDQIVSTEGTFRIKVRNMSELIKRTVQQLEGKSFYD